MSSFLVTLRTGTEQRAEPVGFLLLAVLGHLLQTSQDHEHDDGQQGREDGAHQVVAAAVLADVHQLGDGPADHIHPRDGGREEETCGDGGSKGACCCGYDAGHFTLC